MPVLIEHSHYLLINSQYKVSNLQDLDTLMDSQSLPLLINLFID